MTNKKTKRVLSLFSGCGGMDLGLEGGFAVFKQSVNPFISKGWAIEWIGSNKCLLGETSFKTVFANDIQPYARATWLRFFSGRGHDPETYHLGSIVDLVKAEKEKRGSVFPSDIDIVTGGFPCQDFSMAGKRQGFESKKGHDGKDIDPCAPDATNRGQLYLWMKEVIGLTTPKVFIAENVKGLTTLGDAQAIIERDFSSVTAGGGYLVLPARVLNASNFGVPQRRERVIFIGLKKSALKPEAIEALTRETIPPEFDPYPIETHSPTGGAGKLTYCTVGDIFADLPEPEQSTDVDQQNYSKAKFLGGNHQGECELKTNSISPTIRSGHNGKIEFRRLSADHGGTNFRELSAGKPERRLSIRECARVQTFPDNYAFVQDDRKREGYVSQTSAYKVIGNAVPPLLAYHLARRLEDVWDRLFK